MHRARLAPLAADPLTGHETPAYGPPRPRHPACAAYARFEQVPTNCPHKHRSRQRNMLDSGLCVRNKAGKAAYLVAGALLAADRSPLHGEQPAGCRGLHMHSIGGCILNVGRHGRRCSGPGSAAHT